jgi:hypothetical protein
MEYRRRYFIMQIVTKCMIEPSIACMLLFCKTGKHPIASLPLPK